MSKSPKDAVPDEPSRECRGPRRRPTPWTAESLFEEYGERVYRFCLRLCAGHAADAEDLAQDVLLLTWRSRSAFEGRSAALTYLYRIAINRHQRVRTQTTTAALREQNMARATLATDVSPDLSAQTAVRLDIESALTALPHDLRIAFLIVKGEGRTYREAAQILDIPQGTLQSRVHDATLRLRLLLANTTETVDTADSAAGSAACRPIPTSPSQNRASDQQKENCNAM